MRSVTVDADHLVKSPEPGPAPMLEWLPISKLVVDDTYQRDLKRSNWSAIRKIAAQFRWSHFSTVLVAPIEGGRFAIIDGQHRTHAALLCGFEAVPCQVVQMSLTEQAASFAAVNGLVTKVTTWNIFKAALAAREEWAVACEKAVAEANCALMTRNASTDQKRPGEIYAISLIKHHIANGSAKAVTATLGGLRRSEFGQEADAWSNEILKPLLAAVVDRPWLVKAGVDLSPFIDGFDIYSALDRASEFVKIKRRQGHVGISRYDIASAEIGEGLDKAFPQRMAGPQLALPSQALR